MPVVHARLGRYSLVSSYLSDAVYAQSGSGRRRMITPHVRHKRFAVIKQHFTKPIIAIREHKNQKVLWEKGPVRPLSMKHAEYGEAIKEGMAMLRKLALEGGI